MNTSNPIRILGLMSGSSLDGLDLACCRFSREGEALHWDIEAACTIPFSDTWRDRLLALPEQKGEVVARTHTYFGRYLAELVQQFLAETGAQPELIASHGHTVYHDPDSRFTLQIGDGASLSALTGLPVACNFRSQDVALDGEGAPLAPLADKWLFPDFPFALNIGGIANVSCTALEPMRAFDIAPANQVFDALAQRLGCPYDEGGTLAARGGMVSELLGQLDALDYYRRPLPKSMSNQWVRSTFLPIFESYLDRPADALRTAVEHLARQTAGAVQLLKKSAELEPGARVLVSGGGAYNAFLLERMQALCPAVVFHLPGKEVIEFKEALLMAMLGLFRWEGRPAELTSVTGARRETVLGALYLGR